ncbi:zinc finger protein [Macleaya cordata]|uniref:Zinc finger protein n=1 Tax=Macleaya cordata TaxID=56857 RepID=A0A200PZW7_MACCD|nr:zinc finger protein [Macleaya cordata]
MAETRNPRKPTKKKHQNQNHPPSKTEKPPPPPPLPSPLPLPSPPPPSWVVMKSIFSCKHLQTKEQQQKPEELKEGKNKRCKKMVCSGSLCSNTRVMHRPETLSPEDSKKWGSSSSSSMGGSNGSTSRRSSKSPLNENNNGVVSSSTTTTTTTTTTSSSTSSSSSSTLSSSRSSAAGSFRGMHLRRLSGCYECRMVVDPSLLVSRDPSLRNTLCSCPDCGEVFMKTEDLELHQSVRHAVSELGPEDSSRNIVEIIFQSSWLKKQAPICKIERILKVHNSQKTITRFEDYRESIKAKANKLMKKHPRCVADGNELLRFHCTTFVCSIGVNGSSNLCNSIPQCNVCSIIKNGFKIEGITGGGGICTTATSGKAHDNAEITTENEKRAMLVCRVIAGRVKRNQDGGTEEFDSVAGPTGIYSDLDELSVFNSKAILPCFVVIYGGFNG